MYRVEFTSAALRIFKKLPRDVQELMRNKADVLKENPLSGEVLKGRHRAYRSLHLGYKGVQYRIIYRIISSVQMIMVVLADKRENIYKRLEEQGV